MKTISINTSQHVNIDYELATWVDRALAFAIDLFIVGVFLWVMILVFPDSKYIHYIITLPVFLFANLIIEIAYNGQSLGKKMLRIKIVKINSTPLKVSDFIIRWCFRCLDIYGSLGLLASLFVGSSKYHQRLGDMLGATVVIKLNSTKKLSLSDLLRIQSIADYQPIYHQAIRLNEQEVLTIKQVLDDFKTYKNEAHAQLIDDCTTKVMALMGLEEHVQDKHVDFLKTVLKDYVVLTR